MVLAHTHARVLAPFRRVITRACVYSTMVHGYVRDLTRDAGPKPHIVKIPRGPYIVGQVCDWYLISGEGDCGEGDRLWGG